MRVRCRRDLGEMRARCSRGEIAGEGEIQTRSRRESPAALPLRRGAGGESTRSANPKQHERRGFEWPGPARPLAHGKDLRAKRKKGAGSASHQASPTLRHRGTALLPPLADVCDYLGRRTSIQTRRLGSAPSASAATSSPHSAPQQCDPNDCGGGEGGIGAERCTRGQQRREESGVPAPRPQCLGTRGARRSGSASSRSWA